MSEASQGIASKKSAATAENGDGPAAATWPAWAKIVVGLLLAWHLAAIFVGALATPPSPALVRALADRFQRYFQVVDQGYSYRYYAPDPPPTPVVTATLRFADGSEREVRFPDRSLRPRLLYQRHLNLAHDIHRDHNEAKFATGGRETSRLARAVARSLCREHGCESVTIWTRFHMVPAIEMVRENRARPGSPRLDLDDERFFSAPERVGEFTCDEF